jgi:hypothetical protein
LEVGRPLPPRRRGRACGSLSAVDNPPTLNTVEAGQAIPVKVQSRRKPRHDDLRNGYPKSESIACNSTDPVAGIEETITAGGSSLTYDTLADTYTYVWKTDSKR